MSEYPYHAPWWLSWFPPYHWFKRWECRAQGIDPDTGETAAGLADEAAREIEHELATEEDDR